MVPKDKLSKATFNNISVISEDFYAFPHYLNTMLLGAGLMDQHNTLFIYIYDNPVILL